jgi:hypothetical protein
VQIFVEIYRFIVQNALHQSLFVSWQRCLKLNQDYDQLIAFQEAKIYLMTNSTQRRNRMFKVGIILVVVVILSKLANILGDADPSVSIFLFDISRSLSTFATLQSILLIVAVIELLVEIVEGNGIRQIVPWVIVILLLSMNWSTSWAIPIAIAIILMCTLWTPFLTRALQVNQENHVENEE